MCNDSLLFNLHSPKLRSPACLFRALLSEVHSKLNKLKMWLSLRDVSLDRPLQESLSGTEHPMWQISYCMQLLHS